MGSMKKRNEWVTKHLKREKKLEDRGIADFIRVCRHFFKDMNSWIDEMTDPGNGSCTTYTQQALVWLGILKNACGIESMRQMNEKFNEETCIGTLSFLSGDGGLSEIPDFTTLNNCLEKLSPDCFSDLRKKMVCGLIRSKVFLKNRIPGKYWPVILDGTGLFHFREKHCDNCLVRTVTDTDGKKHKDYYHKVVEAKIVFSDSVIISLGTEFIENESEDVEKQDCENAAAKRLLARIKKQYPRLEICVQGDGLYGVEPLMKLCDGYGWKYLFSLQEGMQKNVSKDYRDLDSDLRHVTKNICAENGTGAFYNGVETITGKTETFNVFEYTYEKKKKTGQNRCAFCGLQTSKLKGGIWKN